jgi:hypothetical protein
VVPTRPIFITRLNTDLCDGQVTLYEDDAEYDDKVYHDALNKYGVKIVENATG